MPTTKAKDHDILVLNPITGQLDVIRKFNPNRIITHNLNQAGNPAAIYDPISGLYLPMDYLIVTDADGNVVTS